MKNIISLSVFAFGIFAIQFSTFADEDRSKQSTENQEGPVSSLTPTKVATVFAGGAMIGAGLSGVGKTILDAKAERNLIIHEIAPKYSLEQFMKSRTIGEYDLPDKAHFDEVIAEPIIRDLNTLYDYGLIDQTGVKKVTEKKLMEMRLDYAQGNKAITSIFEQIRVGDGKSLTYATKTEEAQAALKKFVSDRFEQLKKRDPKAAKEAINAMVEVRETFFSKRLGFGQALSNFLRSRKSDIGKVSDLLEPMTPFSRTKMHLGAPMPSSNHIAIPQNIRKLAPTQILIQKLRNRMNRSIWVAPSLLMGGALIYSGRPSQQKTTPNYGNDREKNSSYSAPAKNYRSHQGR